MLSPEQLALRRTGIGGSEIAAILGEDPFASPFDIWLRKARGFAPVENVDMERGTFLERGVSDWYAYRTGAVLTEPGTIRHSSVAIAFCTPDRVSVLDLELDRILSIKCPRRGDAWGDEGTAEVPPGYLLQLQWEHAILSSIGQKLDQEMHLAALVDGELRIYRAMADLELQAWLLEYAQAWWARHVVADVPPPLDGSQEAGRWFRRRRDSSPVRPATPAEDVRMLELRQALERLEVATLEVYNLKLEMMASIGEAGGIEGPEGVVTFKADKNGKRSLRTKWRK